MAHFRRSDKYDQLIDFYKTMAEEGYNRIDGTTVTPEKVFSNFGSFRFKEFLRPLFKQYGIKTVMDYGAGGGNWQLRDETGQTFQQWMGLDEVHHYEPARDIDERAEVDAVLCFDVLEHVYATDVPYVVDQLFRHAKKLVVANIALYPAGALLPNGENAHITIRSGDWWKGVFDTIGGLYPDIVQALTVSPSYDKATAFEITSPANIASMPAFTTEYK